MEYMLGTTASPAPKNLRRINIEDGKERNGQSMWELVK